MLKLIANVIALPVVADRLIRRAQRTPYFHIKDDDGSVYMERYWLFNPYPHGSDGAGRRWGDWLPSIRLHRILREDRDRHMHDHPWNARTFIMRGWYEELRCEVIEGERLDHVVEALRIRKPGDTACLRFGEYHRITEVSPDGVWTLFVTWRKRGTWGFLVDGKKVPWRTYLGIADTSGEATNG